MFTSKGTLSAVLAASVGSAACFGVVSAFSAKSFSCSSNGGSRSLSSSQPLGATVDPTVVTKKEYQDICGVDFDDTTLASRLAKTAYLYPKHVEVIDDFAPLVDQMVDEIVSNDEYLHRRHHYSCLDVVVCVCVCVLYTLLLFMQVL